jgi:hypothetical protein
VVNKALFFIGCVCMISFSFRTRRRRAGGLFLVAGFPRPTTTSPVAQGCFARRHLYHGVERIA